MNRKSKNLVLGIVIYVVAALGSYLLFSNVSGGSPASNPQQTLYMKQLPREE
jgi:hypothetical protein